MAAGRSDDETKPEQRRSDARGDGAGSAPSDPLRRSRTSGLWIGVVALGVVLVLLIVFITQNTQSVEITFLGWSGSAPLAVAMLISAVAGLFLAAVAGSLRIIQLRRRVGRLTKEKQEPSSPQARSTS